MTDEKKRWQYRFANFKRAYFLLQEALELLHEGKLDQLAQEGLIQRFEYCTELAWKTIKDYLESQNIIFTQLTPRAVIKEGVATQFIERGEDWINLLDARNKMSHTYDFEEFEAVIEEIKDRYILCFSDLYEKLAEADANESKI